MTLAELKATLTLHEVPNLLVFTGPELGIMCHYLQQIQNCLKESHTVVKIDSVADVFRMCVGTMFDKHKKLFIVTDDIAFLKEEKAWNNLTKVLRQHKLILHYHEQDARLGFWKKFKKETVFFDVLEPQVLCKHLIKDFNLNETNSYDLIVGCKADYLRCQLEAHKLQMLVQARQQSINQLYVQCRNDVLCLDSDTTLINFIEAFLKKDYKNIVKNCRLLQNQNEPVVKLLSLLYNSFRNLLIAQTIKQPKNIYQKTGLSYKTYCQVAEFIGYYTDFELENILYELMSLEQAIKSGDVGANIALDYFLRVLL